MRRVAAPVALALLVGLLQTGGAVSVWVPAGWRAMPSAPRGFGPIEPRVDAIAEAEAMRALVADIQTFPRYPAMVPAATGQGEGIMTGSPYTLDFYREGRAGAGMLAIQNWLRAAATRGGWIEVGGDMTQHVQNPMVADSIDMIFARSRSGDGPWIQVGLNPADGRGISLLPVLGPPDHGPTLIRYDASVIWTPRRPAVSLVPADIARIDVAVWPDETAAAPVTATVTSPGRMAPLIAAVNALPIDTDGRMGCLGGGGWATLVFHTARGRRLTVQVDSACYTATVDGRYHLFDQDFRLWHAVQAAALPGGAGAP